MYDQAITIYLLSKLIIQKKILYELSDVLKWVDIDIVTYLAGKFIYFL